MNSNEVNMIHHGEQLFQSGRIEESLSIFNSVLEKDAGNLFALNDKGVALSQLRRYQKAIEVFKSVLRKDNRNSTAAYNLITNYLAIERYTDAEKALIEYKDNLNQDDFSAIQQQIIKLKSSNNGSSPAISPMNQPTFNYSGIRDSITRIQGKSLFFIMAVPKSGTTWMQHLINAHPNVLCSGEGNFNHFIEPLKNIVNEYNSYIAAMNENIGTSDYLTFTRQDLQFLFSTVVWLLFKNQDIKQHIQCIGSKNPTLIKYLELYTLLFPAARFIHIIREGRDVITSAWFGNLRKNREDTLRRWPDFKSFVSFGVEQWSGDIRKARAFGQAIPHRYIELKYEDIHSDPDPSIRRIFHFLEVDQSQDIIEQCKQAGSFETLSKGRERGQENKNAFFRRGIIGDWKNHFDQESLDLFIEHGGSLTCELGYDL